MIELKENRAVTLISLSLTIIILIILSSVALEITLSDEGLFSKAKKAIENYNLSKYEEDIKLAIIEIYQNVEIEEKETIERLKAIQKN